MFKKIMILIAFSALVTGTIVGFKLIDSDNAQTRREHSFHLASNVNEVQEFTYRLALYLTNTKNDLDKESGIALDASIEAIDNSHLVIRAVSRSTPTTTVCEGRVNELCGSIETKIPEQIEAAVDLPSSMLGSQQQIKLTVYVDDLEYYSVIHIDGQQIRVERDGETVSNVISYYPDGIATVSLEESSAGSSCDSLSDLQTERFLTQDNVKLASTMYPDLASSNSSILVINNGFKLGDIVAIDSNSLCKARLSNISLE